MVRLNQMLRTLLAILFLLLCPALAWAQDDFCGHSQVRHACPMHADQLCQCQDHQFCLRLASEKPSPAAPAPPRLEVLCPGLPGQVFRTMPALLSAPGEVPLAQPLCPSVAPEPPPPRV